MPLADTFPTAGSCRMLSDKYRMSLHWCLLPIIWNNCRCFPLCDKVSCMLPDRIQSFFINIINIFLFQMKTATEFGMFQPVKSLLIPFFFRHFYSSFLHFLYANNAAPSAPQSCASSQIYSFAPSFSSSA